jgi:hypothetical protein
LRIGGHPELRFNPSFEIHLAAAALILLVEKRFSVSILLLRFGLHEQLVRLRRPGGEFQSFF